MTSQFEYKPLSEPDEAKQLGAILSQCFMGSPSDSQIYIDRLGIENFRCLQADHMVGGLALIPMGQWWGGQRVPMTGIASVGVAPEYRGTGAALALLQQMLQELHRAGVAISALYPATQRLYRKVGYEQGGTHSSWSIATAEIQMRERLSPIRPADSIEIATFAALQQQQAQQHPGHLDRHAAIWQGFLQSEAQQPLYAYLIGPTDRPQGYVIFSQSRSKEGEILRVRDWAVLSAEAGQSLWTFLADHRSQVTNIHWQGAAIDPLMLLLPEQSHKLRSSMAWLLRIVNVRSALEKRGYPSGVATELHLEVEDDLLPDNTGKFLLAVSQGQGQITQGGTGAMKLNIRGLAALYSGLYTPYQLQLMGLLDASTTALNAASLLFAGASPWLPDFF